MTQFFLKLFACSHDLARRQPLRRSRLWPEELESRLAPSVNVLTFHNDIAGSGLNASESQLNPATVKVGSFGKLFATTVDGQVYAEPLVDTGVTITSGVNTKGGAAGVHDVVFVATEHDSLYALDAGPSGAVLWQRSFLDPSNPGGNTNSTLGASAITTVSSNDVGVADLSPEIGITGTPVIDPATNRLYVVVKTKETISGSTHFVQRLHAIKLGDGTDATAPALVGDTTGFNTNNTPIYVYGTGDGHVTDPYNGTGRQVVQFHALREHQRGALNLVNNQVYVEWASHGDAGPYHGWVVVWNVSGGGLQLSGVLNVSPNNGLAGIWQGGGRLSFEANGSAFYFETGNGSGGAPTLNASGFPSNANYNEALVKVVADPGSSATSQNPNGWGLKVADYFIPYNVVALDGADSDFGSGAPLLLPDAAGIPGHPHLLVASGKEGKIYLVDRDNMGHFDASNDRVLNAVPDGSGHNTPPVQLGASLSTPAYFNGRIYWTSGYGSTANAYQINSNGTLSITSQTSKTFGYLPGSVVVSANGTSGGVVWVMDRSANQIHAYDASTMASELWYSGQAAGGADTLGAVVKFAVPTVANGKVYVGTANSLVAYGLTQQPTAAPNAPVLAATALSGSSINLTWTDSTTPPNTATGYKIEQSTDNVTFTQVTTAPAGTTSIAIGGLAAQTKYYFRIRGFNSIGNSAYSNVANATTSTQVVGLDFSGGFAGSTSKLTYNGAARINGSKAELTNSGQNQAGSVFSTSTVDVTQFTTQFTFQLTAGTTTADGITFCIQANGATALGQIAGGLGYGPRNTGGAITIPNSLAIKFDLANTEGEGVDSTGLYTGGVAPTSAGSIDLTSSGIDLYSGDTFQVNISYNGTTLSVIITDKVTAKSATQNYPINIPTILGGTTGYVGFTGSTGTVTATQDVLTWTFSSSAATSPNAPSGLGATPASATSVALNWTNNASNQTGFHLDRATDGGCTANLITQTLAANLSSFTDTATGLAPGGTFYYRLRAFNSAGDSGNSNVASVTIPLAPPKATNQRVTNVTTTQIDMSWQDNAGSQCDGYKILRAVNRGTFVQIVTLPRTSRTPPSTYTWSDTNLTPGTFYEYHILCYNVSGNNDFAGVNATTLTLPPSGVTATPAIGVVTLSWTAPTGAQTYNLYRSTTAGGEVLYVSGLTSTSYSDTAVNNGTTYYYKVTAVNANVGIVPAIPSESAPSTEVQAAAVSNGLATTTTVTSSANPQTAGQAVSWTATVRAAGVVNGVSFETGDFSQAASHVGGAIVSSPALDGTFSLQLQRSNSVANVEIRQSGTTYYNLPTAYYSMLFEYTANPGEGGIVNFQDTASGYKAALHLSAANKLLFYDGAGTLLATGTTVLAPGQVYVLSAKIGTGTSAAWEVRLNGAVELSGTGNLGTANNGSLKLGGNATYTTTYYYDDVAINSQGYPGPVPTGTVQFAIDGVNFGAPVALSGGSATSGSNRTLSAGVHTITATYSGDSSYAGSTGTLAGGQTITSQSSTVNVVDFETGDFSQATSRIGGAIVTSPALDGTFSLQLQRSNSTANYEIRQSGTTYYNLPTAYYSFLFEYTSNPGEGGIVNFQDTASGYKAALHLSPADTLQFYNNTGTLLATGTTVLAAGQVYTISAQIGTGSNAAWEIHLNGTVELSGTGNLGTTNNGSLKLGGNATYTTVYYYDDVTIDSQGFPGGGALPPGPAPGALRNMPVPAIDAARTPRVDLQSTTGGSQPPMVPGVFPLQPLSAVVDVRSPVVEAASSRRTTAPTTALDALFADWGTGLTPELTTTTRLLTSKPFRKTFLV